MALGKLQLIRQDMLRVRAESGSSTAGGQVPAQQIERYKRWADSFNMSENCRDLSSDVTAVQDQSRDIVFARQVLKSPVQVWRGYCLFQLFSLCS